MVKKISVIESSLPKLAKISENQFHDIKILKWDKFWDHVVSSIIKKNDLCLLNELKEMVEMQLNNLLKKLDKDKTEKSLLLNRKVHSFCTLARGNKKRLI